MENKSYLKSGTNCNRRNNQNATTIRTTNTLCQRFGYIKYLKRLTLINFRSYENVTIEFDKGINAFVGESGKGKTNILRALALLFYNEPRGNRYVRRVLKNVVS